MSEKMIKVTSGDLDAPFFFSPGQCGKIRKHRIGGKFTVTVKTEGDWAGVITVDGYKNSVRRTYLSRDLSELGDFLMSGDNDSEYTLEIVELSEEQIAQLSEYEG